MSYQGHCNSGNIQVIMKKQPEETILCHCYDCRRAGGPYSVSYIVDSDEIQVIDQHISLTAYLDTNTVSGNTITRKLCGTCGSPILTEGPLYQNKAVIKASLFDSMSTPAVEAFATRRESWVKPIDRAQQK